MCATSLLASLQILSTPPLRRTPLFGAALAAGNLLDRMALRVPGLELMAWMFSFRDGKASGMKRMLDLTAAAAGLLLLSPLLVPVAILIWLQDYHSPFYIAARSGRGGRPFRMVKFRSMEVRADRTGVDSTPGDDPRITAVGRIRRTKLDEVPQLWNVLRGDMSLVGPRPNVDRETIL